MRQLCTEIVDFRNLTMNVAIPNSGSKLELSEPPPSRASRDPRPVRGQQTYCERQDLEAAEPGSRRGPQLKLRMAGSMEVGDRVMLHSLVNAAKYNGCPGRVLARVAAAPDGSAKWQVMLYTGETLAVKAANITGIEMDPTAPSSCSECGKSPAGVKLSRCANCWTTRYCSRECQTAAWPAHKTQCKESACPFRKQLFRSMADGGFEQNHLAASISVDRSELMAIYIRDKFPTRRELHASGLDKILERRLDLQGRKHMTMCGCRSTLCHAITCVVGEIFSFADTAKVDP